MDMICLPRGVALRGYERPAEDAYFVSEGCITVGWEEAGHVEERLGPKAIFNPAGRAHYSATTGSPTRSSYFCIFPHRQRARGGSLETVDGFQMFQSWNCSRRR
jgi:hypothetical protein